MCGWAPTPQGARDSVPGQAQTESCVRPGCRPTPKSGRGPALVPDAEEALVSAQAGPRASVRLSGARLRAAGTEQALPPPSPAHPPEGPACPA